MPARTTPRRAAHKVRIIGGRWKRWQIAVADRPGLRPTPDRVRETLFNWLDPELPGARCLDLFAGTGVLGLEALSRGASRVAFVEQDRATAAGLQAQLDKLQCRDGHVTTGDALAYLQQPPREAVDVVFLDPPYHSACLDEACRLLASQGWLAQGARVYLEFARNEPPPSLPAGWRIHRETQAGEVNAWLCHTGD